MCVLKSGSEWKINSQEFCIVFTYTYTVRARDAYFMGVDRGTFMCAVRTLMRAACRGIERSRARDQLAALSW